MQSVLSDKHFHDETAAYEFVEARVWPNGPVCPHCGDTDRISPMKGKSTRVGTYKCYQCRKPFTVKIGTIFEASHIPMRHWLQAIFLMSSSKKGISSNQLARTLGCTIKTAWFMSHRIREAMNDHDSGPLGGEGKIIESDEAYWGPKDLETNPKMKFRRRGKPGPGGKSKIMTLVERGGRARSIKVADLTDATMKRILLENADTKSRLMTDEGTAPTLGLLFSKHETVKHGAKEYARGDVTTNTVEGFFSVFKRGMRGTYQHCDAKHLQRYLYEFDFRYNNRAKLGVNDVSRANALLKGIVGKRLTYKTANQRS
jgi:transposase-like protein